MKYDGILTIATGRSRNETNWRPERITWEGLVDRLSQPVITKETGAQYRAMTRDERGNAKDVGGFVGGDFNGNRKGANVTKRCLLALDADYGDTNLWDSWCYLYGNAAFYYTTHSHTPEQPRLRLVFPLAREVNREEYEAIARKVASWLDIEAFDDTTYQPHRLMYWPSMPCDVDFLCGLCDGPWLDPDEVLASYANWRDVSSWPVSSRQQKVLERSRRQQGDPTTKAGIVGAFCRVYDIPRAIETFLPEVYTQVTETRYTYTGGTSYGGLVLYDNGTFAYSHHDTDPISGLEVNAFDLVRIHKFKLLDTQTPEGTPINELPSYNAMKEMLKDDPEITGQLYSAIRATAAQDFDERNLRNLGGGENDLTDQGLAVDFARENGDVLCYQKNLGWVSWDGTKWVPDSESLAKIMLMCFVQCKLDGLKVALQKASSDDEKKHLQHMIKQTTNFKSANRLANVLRLVRDMLSDCDLTDFDADPWALNTPGGLVNLRTGEIAPSNSSCKCTQITAVAPESGCHPKWQALLDSVTGGDKGLEKYLQDVAGMALVGAVYEEGVTIAYGPGGNGKSTFFGIWQDVLGDYAESIRPELLAPKQSGAEPFGLERVRGKRLVVASETEEGAFMNISVMKRLTSQDDLNVNPKGRDPFTFKPTHTLVLHTNHLPKLRSLDDGTKRRLALIPMLRKLSHGEMITDLRKSIVEEEGTQILAWMIEGSKRFWENNMKLVDKPAVVERATQEFVSSQDWLQVFLSDCCELKCDEAVLSSDLFRAYRTWCVDNNEKNMLSQRVFTNRLIDAGYTKKKVTKGYVWPGIGLKDLTL